MGACKLTLIPKMAQDGDGLKMIRDVLAAPGLEQKTSRHSQPFFAGILMLLLVDQVPIDFRLYSVVMMDPSRDRFSARYWFEKLDLVDFVLCCRTLAIGVPKGLQ